MLTESDKREFENYLRNVGGRSQALVLISMDQNGVVTMMTHGDMIQLSFLRQSLDMMLNETLSGRTRRPQGPVL